ncbi:MAG: transglycosylase domain-containing protein [Burkholderiales bacterium]|nr:transglycosylase domain-containing protein [Burkholderiales bacterium]
MEKAQLESANPAQARPFWRFARPWRVAQWAVLGAGTAAATVLIYLGVLVFTTPGVEALQKAQGLRPSVILSADGEVIGRFATAYQAPVALKDVSPELVKALIATEDHRFYEHGGIDFKRTLASAWNTLQGDMQGGSTLTQQLARNLFPQEIGNERNLNRKLREAITALRLERHSSKEQILESYLNSAPFLYNVRGIEMAARTYFGKPAAQLDTAQGATLVGMLKGTQRYNPVRNPERALERRNLVLAQMVKRGSLDAARFERLKKQPLALDFKRPEDGGIGQARHFVETIRERLVEWADAHDVDLDRDGLVIRTTLDSKLQRLAQDAVVQQVAMLQRVAAVEWSETRMRSANARSPEPKTPFAHFWKTHPQMLAELARDSAVFRDARQAGASEDEALAKTIADADLMQKLRDGKTRLSAGFIAIDPTSGAVKAWVGSPDFAREQFDHVAQARRQPGSTFKPFVYGAALQRGFSTERSYMDEDIEIRLADGKLWKPTDGGGPSFAPMTLRQGLVQSKNTITAQLMQDVGAEAVVNFAQAAGVRESKLDPVPSLALGTSPVTLLEMANAYATLAAMGVRREPLLVTRIEDRNGRLLAAFDSSPERQAEQVLDAALIARLVDVMRGVVQTGTGAAMRGEWGLRGDAAGKTGTTQDNTDGWFMLMQPGLVAGAWVGFNDPRVTIRSNYWGQGGHNALRIVGDFWRQGQKAKLIDTKAEFPKVSPEAPEPIEADPGSSPDAPPGEGPIGAALVRLLGLTPSMPRSQTSSAESEAMRQQKDQAP